MHLEPITPAVASTFKAVRLRALLDTPLAFGSTHAKEVLLTDSDWLKRAAQWNGDGAIAYLAFDGHEACGIAAGFLDVGDGTTAHLVSMWVAPTHRRHGVGKALVNSIVEWARARQAKVLCLMVTSINDAALRFYEQLGFAKTGHTEPYPNDSSLNEYEMVLRLVGEPLPSTQ